MTAPKSARRFANLSLSLVLAFGLMPIAPAQALAEDFDNTPSAVEAAPNQEKQLGNNTASAESESAQNDENAQSEQNINQDFAPLSRLSFSEPQDNPSTQADESADAETPELLDSGIDNERVEWKMWSNGNLELSAVSGSDGKMSDFSTAPWNSMYRLKIVSVTIHDGVASLGEKAFYRCTKLESISLPEGITSIDAADAFAIQHFVHSGA